MQNQNNKLSIVAPLVRARADAAGIPIFPEPFPESLSEAYDIQRCATLDWPDTVVGWKVGRISADAGLGEDRFVGPIFRATVIAASDGDASPFPVFPGGFAAVEAELIAVLSRDIEASPRNWTAQEAEQLIASLHIGVEVAGTPVADVPLRGPLASVAAFGNNAGLIVGPQVTDGLSSALTVPCTTMIDGVEVGQGTASHIPGGPSTALAFAITRLGHLGVDLPAGTMFATGAITGVHQILLGQTAVADFGDLGSIPLTTVRAQPTIRS
jgi:2-keto-4-pentenoate hydratase